MHVMEQFNRETWRKPLSLKNYRAISGHINDGERAVFDLARVEGARVLDIGVGGGRTTALVKSWAGAYIAIDYTAEMIEVAQTNHPGFRFQLMDARDLSAFANASFDLVIFSYNGIDSVDPEGRLAILNEVSRVLSPGGTFLFSTFHRGWEGFNDRRIRGDIVWSGNPLRLGLRYARHAVGIQRAFRRRKLEERDGEHAILLHFAHHYGIMVYATTPEQINRQLSDSGFETPARLFDEKGREISGDASSAIEHFHVMARKPLNDKGRPM